MDLLSSENSNFTADIPLPPSLIQSKIHETLQLKRVITEDAAGMLLEAAKTVKGRRVAVAILSAGYKVISKRLLAIDHPNIAKAHQIIKQANGTEAIVLDFPEGNPLSTLFAHGVLFSKAQAVALVLQLLSAFHAVHKRKESIRTLGGNNIFIAEEPTGRLRLKLVNCGIGTTGLDLRDPNYLSPEQIMDSSSATPKSDIWSAGAIFYHLLFGRPLFQGNSPLEVAQKIMLEDPVMESRGGRIPTTLIDVLRRAVERDENQRFRDIPEMVSALLPFRTQGGIAPKRPQRALLGNPASEEMPSIFPEASPERRDDTEPVALQNDQTVNHGGMTDEEWAEAPTVPPDDPLAETGGVKIHVTEPASQTAAPTTAPPLEGTAIVGEPRELPEDNKRETRAEVPKAIRAETRGRPPSLPLEPYVESSDDSDEDAMDSETIVAANRDHPSVMDRTKIADLAAPTQNLGRKEPAKPAAEIAAALKQQLSPPPLPEDPPPRNGLFGTARTLLSEQPALAIALGVFTIVFIAFIVILVSAIRNSTFSRSATVQRQTLATAESEIVEDPNDTKTSPPPTAEKHQTPKKETAPSPVVTIDLLRVPANAKILVDDAQTRAPLRLEKSRTAVKLSIRAKGFKPFERLIVPDQNRKIIVKMESR